MASISNWIFLSTVLLLSLQSSFALFDFKCQDRDGEAPALPDAYSTNIRINYLLEQLTMEVKYATIGRTNQEVIEIKTQTKHAKYITTGENDTALYIEYNVDQHPTCKVMKSTKLLKDLDKGFAGKNGILLKALEVMMFPNEFDLYSVALDTEQGVISRRYEGCLTDPKINVSLSFAVETWNHTRVSSLHKNVKYPVMAVAEIDDAYMTALYSNFDPTTPDDAIFQPPEDVYCAGYRADKKPPQIKDFFSYNSEITVYESALGLAPIVYFREVYYDYPSQISRIDFHDALSDDSDIFSEVWAGRKSIIHDYNAGSQYILNPVTGKCTIDTFQMTFSVLSAHKTEKNTLLKGDEYFFLNGTKTSYNGQYRVNGKLADVYTASIVDPETNKNAVISWAFATEKTRVVGNEKLEKNVLLRIYVRPETDLDYEGVTQINFYNFVNEEPNVFTYDISSCFNDTSSKTFVLTFPGYDSLKGTEKLIGMKTHITLKNTLGIRKQRVNLKEVISTGKYIYVEFAILEESPVKGNEKSKEISMDEAVEKLKKAISEGKFSVDVPVSGPTRQVISLRPEPNGLNEFSGDRKTQQPSVVGYKEGSVVALTIGMLLLGFLLGAVTLNLVMSKKFGISLFQKSSAGDGSFNNPLNESSM